MQRVVPFVLFVLFLAGCGEQVRFTPSADAPANLAPVDEARVKVVSAAPAGVVEMGRATSTLNWMWADTARSYVVRELGSHGATFVVLSESKQTNMAGVDDVTVTGTGYITKP